MVLLPNALLLEKSTFDQKEAGFGFVFSLHYSQFSGILNKNCMSLGRSSPISTNIQSSSSAHDLSGQLCCSQCKFQVPPLGTQDFKYWA